MIRWITGTTAQYDALETKDPSALYFLTDTHLIYKGNTLFTEAVSFYTETRPTTGALGRIYIDDATLAGSVYNGVAWKEIILPVQQTLTSESAGTRPVSGIAVKDFVDAAIAESTTGVNDLEYTPENRTLVVTKNGIASSIQLTNLATDMSYDGSTGKITLTDAAGATLKEITIPLDNFLVGGHYDEATGNLVLELQNGDTINIPASELVDLYEFLDSSSVELVEGTDEQGNNTVTANVKISAAVGNGLRINADGLFAAATDISGKMDKVDTEAAGQVITANAEGNAAASGYTLGTATIAETPTATTLATEAAVNAIKVAIETNASNTYVAQSSIASTLDSENPSAAKVASEAAVVTALSWTILT